MRAGRRLVAACVAVVVIGTVAATVHYRRVNRRAREDAVAAFEGGDVKARIAVMRQRAAAFGPPVDVAPFGLVTHVPSDWSCARGGDWVVACKGPCWTVHWDVEPDSEPIEEMGHDDGDQALQLAGFDGVLRESIGSLRPALTYTFRGWRDDPARGRLRLQVVADACYSYEQRTLDGLAVLLATSTGPGGLATSWPSKRSRAVNAEAERNYAFLASDANRAGWEDAAGWLVAKRDPSVGEPPGTRDGDSLADRTPGVTELIERRIDARLAEPPTLASLQAAGRLAGYLTTWDRDRGARALPRVAEKLRAASTAGAATAEGGRWVALEVDLAADREKAGDAQAAADVARWMSGLDPAPVFRDPRRTLSWLLAHGADREAAAVAARWLDPARTTLPDDADFGGLAGDIAAWWRKSPAVRRHVLAMLSDRRPAGIVVLRNDEMLDVRGKYSWGRHLEPGELAHVTLGTTMPLRACDHYANAVAGWNPDPHFALWADEPTRDRQIAAVRAYVATARP